MQTSGGTFFIISITVESNGSISGMLHILFDVLLLSFCFLSYKKFCLNLLLPVLKEETFFELEFLIANGVYSKHYL